MFTLLLSESILYCADYQPVLELVALLVQTCIRDYQMVKAENQSCEILSKVMQLMLCILDGLHSTDNMAALARVSLEWAPIFELRNLRYFGIISLSQLVLLFDSLQFCFLPVALFYISTPSLSICIYLI